MGSFTMLIGGQGNPCISKCIRIEYNVFQIKFDLGVYFELSESELLFRL